MRFVEEHGIVLASAKGSAPRLIEHIAGEAISGNWWSHPRANAIYNVLSRVQGHEDVLVCRLVGGKITLVHRRVWAPLVRVAACFPAPALARVSEEHTTTGKHAVHEVPFPEWVPAEVWAASRALSEEDALAALPRWLVRSRGGSR